MPMRSSTVVPKPVFGPTTLNALALSGLLVGAWYALVLMGLHANPEQILRTPSYPLENLLSMLGWGAHAILAVAGLIAAAKVFAAVWKG